MEHSIGLPKVICTSHPGWIRLFNKTWELALGNIDLKDSLRFKPMMTCMPGVGIFWQWDTCFMTHISKYSNGIIPTMNGIDNLYSLQRDDGFISMAYSSDSGKECFGERINPPLFAWAEWDYFMVSGDSSRFPSVLPALTRYFSWINCNRRRKSGLYWFEDSGSSGLDNSPRSGYTSQYLNGSDICHIDLACQQAQSALYLAKIAGYLVDGKAERMYSDFHRNTGRLINEKHWCSEHGFYYDLFARNDPQLRMNFVNHKTIAAYWAAASGVAQSHQASQLVSHLYDPSEFGARNPVPSLSRSDPNFNEMGAYWRGGVWSPTNYMVTTGLKKYGFFAQARDISMRHLLLLEAVADNPAYGGLWESYSPEFEMPATGEDNQIVRNDFVGWTGLSTVTMLIENIFGFTFDASCNQILWEISDLGRYGIEHLLFNGGYVCLTCEELSNQKGGTVLRVEAEKPFTLKPRIFGTNPIPEFSVNEVGIPISPGVHSIRI